MKKFFMKVVNGFDREMYADTGTSSKLFMNTRVLSFLEKDK